MNTPPILVTGDDLGSLRRGVERELDSGLSWVEPGDPRVADAEIWFCAGAPPVATVEAPRLRWIQSGWAGVEGWFARPEWRAEVTLTRTVGDFPARVAEYVFGYLLAWDLDIPGALRQMEARTWRRWIPDSLAGRSLLVVGLGTIGNHVATVGRALGLAVEGIRRGPVGERDRSRGVHDGGGLEACLARADVVVNLLPRTRSTERIFDAGRFACFRSGSTFVHVPRGATVDEAALMDALARGRPGRALLDVFEEEPLPSDHPLRLNPAVWVTPHIAGVSTPGPLARDFAENVRRWSRGGPLRFIVDRARGY